MKIEFDPILSDLNEPQRQAVLHTNGPLLILAGAGSGKTRALTHRIARLIRDGVPPWQILAVTFTNKAANEMKERIKNLLQIIDVSDVQTSKLVNQQTSKLPTMGTFHSICARILRKDYEHLGRSRNFVIYDETDQEKLMKLVLNEMHIDFEELKPRTVLGHIGRMKCEALSPKDARKDAVSERMHRIISAYEKYQARLLQANALDFDDLLLETIRLLREVPEVLDRYRRTWQYIHVDEYQDTNHSQYLLIKLLAEGRRNICVIGDPDQSIYAFRGADIRNILEFEKDYPDSARIKLEKNYRSTQIILDASDRVIAQNPRRPQKKMWTERKEGPKISINEVEDEQGEAGEAIKKIEELSGKNVKLNDQVILYRTNAQSRLFEEACMRAGLPYRIIGGVKFYQRREVKDILAYLHIILNPHNTLSLMRILNVPARKIGKTTIERIQAFGEKENMDLWDCISNAAQISGLAETMPAGRLVPRSPKGEVGSPKGEGWKQRIIGFSELVSKLRELSSSDNVANLTLKLLDATDMEKWLRDGTDEGESRWENVKELMTVMHKYDSLDPQTSLSSFLEEAALVSEVDKLSEAKDDALTLMTLHLCKGLEFEHVIIAGCEEGLFPHSQSHFDNEQLEEERRLMYVGMTRAKTHLTIMHARQRMLWGELQANSPSRFLSDLPEHTIERRSSGILSSFALASKAGMEKAEKGTLEPFHQEYVNAEFNQELGANDFEINQDNAEMEENSRVSHPKFGTGTVAKKRGDIIDVRFDSGERKSFALSIAPIRLI